MAYMHVLTMDAGTPDEIVYAFNCALITTITVVNNVCTVVLGSDIQHIKFSDHAQAEELRKNLIYGIQKA